MFKLIPKKSLTILSVLAIFGLVACTNKKEKLSKVIYELEVSDSSSSQKGMNELANLYYDFAKNFPKDSISERYLFKGFMFKYITKHWDDAIAYANFYKSTYPISESYHHIHLKLADLFKTGKNNLDSSAHYYFLADGKAQFSTDEKRQASKTLEQFGDTNKNPKAIFTSAKFALNANEFAEALRIYDKLITQYPEFEKTPDALMAAGFICWDNLKDSKKATAYYKELVEKYPNHPLAKEAQTLLNENMLTMSDLELSEYLMNKNKTKTP
jgi:outer membrane protein assembly factor BamD (BamD/ComL family)